MYRSNSGCARHSASPLSCVAIAIAMLALAACGGGGSDDPPPPSSPVNPPAPPPPPPPSNTAPTVNAGEDQTIQLPTNTVDLQGSATDPDNDTLTYSWSASPSEGVTFADASAAATQVTFTNAGTYTLTLTVSDGAASASDTVVITVTPADEPPPVSDVWPGVDVETDPNHGWATAAPEDVGMDLARLQEAEAYALTGGGSGMIVRHGYLVHKWGNIDSRVSIKSATKSIGSLALGMALDQQLVALSDTAQSRYAGFGQDPADPTPPDPTWLSQITIQQLATHTAGFAKPGDSGVDLIYQPGTTWSYSDGGLNWLADTLTNVFQRDLSALLTERVWTPLNITTDDVQWRVPPASAPRPPIGTIQLREFASGIAANPNALARVGLLFLRKGMWRDQRIVSEEFVELVSTPRPETAAATVADPTGFPSANLNHGMMWWTNATGLLPDVPSDAYWAWGLGDSLIVVIPSLDIVVSRVGSDPDSPAGPHWRTSPDGTALWDGNYEVLRPFLTPIVQSVTNP